MSEKESPSDEEVFAAVLAAAKTLYRKGLVEGTSGNVSGRLRDGNVVMTPSSLPYEPMVLEDLVVVETDDAVLVARKDRVQQVKDVVAKLKAEQRSQAALHREVHRPWCSYDSIDMAEGFQVKRIKVKPGARLSLQSHAQRAEHWIVVSGVARVTRDNDVFELFANQSTYIPIGAKHRLENPGAEMLELIEVQSGDYLSEDDIVRYDDVYGRS